MSRIVPPDTWETCPGPPVTASVWSDTWEQSVSETNHCYNWLNTPTPSWLSTPCGSKSKIRNSHVLILHLKTTYASIWETILSDNFLKPIMKWWPSQSVSLVFDKEIRMKGTSKKLCFDIHFQLKNCVETHCSRLQHTLSPKSDLLVKF